METTAVRMLVARNNGVSAASMQRRRWPAPQRKMNRANKISSTTTFLVALLVTLGNLHNPITICTGMEKYATVMAKSGAEIVIVAGSSVLRYDEDSNSIGPWIGRLNLHIRLCC